MIAQEKIDAPSLHGSLYRVMYHSRSVLGADIPVTGIIAVPASAPPADGYPIISWAHGTTGIADVCAPSLGDASAIVFANVLLDRGYLVTATDYEGLGTPGRHPYVVGDSEARGVLDIVRAARHIPDLHASDRYVVWGHSQGGHAAMFSLHIAQQWAPELDLLGVVAGAPPSQFLFLNQALQQSPFRYYLLMAAAGFNAAYGDTNAPLDAVLTPLGIQKVSLVDQGCAGSLAAALGGLNFNDLQKADPADVPVWRQRLIENDPGQFTGPASPPLLVIHGGSDEQIPTVASEIMFGQLCKVGQGIERWVYPGQSHAGVINVSINDMLSWIADRFAGRTPRSTSPVGQADVQTTACAAVVPPSSTTTSTTGPTTTTTVAAVPVVSTTAVTSQAAATRASTTTTTTTAPTTTVPAQVLGTQTSRTSTVALTGSDTKRWLILAGYCLVVGLLLVFTSRARLVPARRQSRDVRSESERQRP